MWPFGPSRRQSQTPAGKPSRVPPDGQLGPRGEKLACRYLRRAGMKILARNYRCPAGEADILALDRIGAEQVLVFVEVKTRSGRRYTEPESAVNAAKQRKLRGIANYYLAAHQARVLAVRFDVVAIVIPPGGKPDIRHIPGAFE
ncbi:MAG: YraN family protein [Planctomycetota bacterium]|nr:MAG: YraN family protein [Planctomycetota bacterium]